MPLSSDLELLALISEMHPVGGTVDRSDLVEALWRNQVMEPAQVDRAIQRLADEGLIECHLVYRPAHDGRLSSEGRAAIVLTGQEPEPASTAMFDVATPVD